MSSDCEVFASILLKDPGKKRAAGVDLSQYEVKSALDGGNYEYQYHKNTGKEKLRKDMEVGHLFLIIEKTCDTLTFVTYTEVR